MSARVIMVASGKGGTGKSTVSVLTGAALAARGRRVLLVELDSALRSVDYIAGVYGKTVYDVEDVLCGRCDAGKALVESPLYPGLFVISAPYSGGQVAAGALQSFLQQAGGVFDDIVKTHLSQYATLDNLPDKVAIHINDTHPTLAIPELMRILLRCV